jgi:hypothetical protein
MSVQFGILARLTWWEYSWDIMEPGEQPAGWPGSILVFLKITVEIFLAVIFHYGRNIPAVKNLAK